MAKAFFKVFVLLLFACPVFSQDLDSLLNLSAFTEESELQKVLNQNLTVSSSKAMTTRETPGIISLITAEEIQNSGARDLIDVLRLVPGFDVAQDISLVTGIALRGNWSHEGKVLVMLDGHAFNDLLYQNVALGNHFAVDAIERIEIIRGPGSAIYGGSAEYGVINIITKAASTQNGIRAFGTAGFNSGATSRTNGGFSVASKKQHTDFDISFFKGRGIVSDGLYATLYGDTVDVDLAESSHADPLNINAGFRIQDLHVRGMFDRYNTNDPYTKISFDNLSLDVKYDFRLSEKLTLTPQMKYSSQVPWQYKNTSDDEVTFKVRAKRNLGILSLNYDITRKLNLNAGLIYFKDKAEDLVTDEYFQGKNTIEFNNMAVFAQGLLKYRLVNATIGFRYEKNSQYGDAFVPRFALTKKIENFHFKALYSQSFRAPAIENINLALDPETITPEKSQVVELELGYQFTPEMLLAVNAYSLSTKDVIVYASSIENPDGSYENFSRTGTSGMELVYTIRKKNWYSNLTYSFSKASSKNTIESYQVPGNDDQFVGMLNSKLTLNSNVNLTKVITFNTSFIYGGKRYAYTHYVTETDDSGNEIQTAAISKIDPYLLMNAFFNYKDIFKGLTLGIGVYDLLNQRPIIPQAYNGDYSPIPGRSREYVIKLSYQLDFKK